MQSRAPSRTSPALSVQLPLHPEARRLAAADLLELRLGKQKLQTAATLVDVPVAGGVVVLAAGVDQAGPQVDEPRAAGAVVIAQALERITRRGPRRRARRRHPGDQLDVRPLAIEDRPGELRQIPGKEAEPDRRAPAA